MVGIVQLQQQQRQSRQQQQAKISSTAIQHRIALIIRFLSIKGFLRQAICNTISSTTQPHNIFLFLFLGLFSTFDTHRISCRLLSRHLDGEEGEVRCYKTVFLLGVRKGSEKTYFIGRRKHAKGSVTGKKIVSVTSGLCCYSSAKARKQGVGEIKSYYWTALIGS